MAEYSAAGAFCRRNRRAARAMVARLLIEIGPHPVMASALAEIAHAQKSQAISVASLRRGEDERSTMLHGLAALYRSGATVRWDALYHGPRARCACPPIPWQRQRLWHESHRDRARASERAAASFARRSATGSRNRPGSTASTPASSHGWPITVWPARPFCRRRPIWKWRPRRCANSSANPTSFLEEVRFHHLLFLPGRTAGADLRAARSRRLIVPNFRRAARRAFCVEDPCGRPFSARPPAHSASRRSETLRETSRRSAIRRSFIAT